MTVRRSVWRDLEWEIEADERLGHQSFTSPEAWLEYLAALIRQAQRANDEELRYCEPVYDVAGVRRALRHLAAATLFALEWVETCVDDGAFTAGKPV